MKKNLLLIVLTFTVGSLNAQSSCQADFTYNTTGLTVAFADTSSGTTATNWNWNFGDGNTSTQQNPVHTYTQSGTYIVCLSIYTPFTNCQSTFCDSIAVAGNSCSASFTYNADLTNPNMISFYDYSFPTPGTWLWNFGDGNTDSIQNPVHIYTSPGTYNVCLTIGDTNGCSNTYCQFISVGNQGCSAYFDYSHSSNPFTFVFADSSSGNPTGWFWDFNDGGSSFLQNPTHTFNATGFYDVCLTISDSVANCVDTYCMYVEVSNCYASFTYTVDSTNPYMLTFTDNSVGSPTAWEWDFDDGDTSQLQNPTHIFTSGGWHDICLTMSNNTCNNTDCQFLFIGPATSCYEYWNYQVDQTNANMIYFIDNSWGTAPTNWTWSFGDGDTSHLQNPVHVYSTAGNYQVCCSISDSTGAGCNATDCYVLAVGDVSTCTAYFNYNAIYGSVLSFVDSSSGSIPDNYEWDFGIWGTSSQKNPFNNFQSPGTYYVCLTISDNASCYSTYCDSVTVSTAGTEEYSLQNDFLMYPNPVKDNLFIQNLSSNQEEFTLKIFNPMGELIEQRIIAGNMEAVDFSNKAAGLYLIQLQNKKSIVEKRVMITR